VEGTPFELAVRRAIDRRDRHDVETTWFDSLGLPGRPDLDQDENREGMVLDRQRRRVRAPADVVFAEVERLGGSAGWPYGNLLWRVRGLMDRLVGGPGMRLGRRDPNRVRVGDAVDFWRVEEVRPAELLRLRAEMRLPGRAWLQFEVAPDEAGSRLVQTAFFEPRGLSGRLYWYAMMPAHLFIFRGQMRNIVRRAERAARRAREVTEPAARDAL
jgi:hypothetical protein